MRKRKVWLPIVLLILIAGLGYTVYAMFFHAEADYVTISEMKSQAEILDSQPTRVSGKVAPGSIQWDEEAEAMRFVLADEKDSLNIFYKGIVPDNFKPGVNLIVTGKYRPDGIFEAVSFDRPRSFCNSCH